MKTIFEKWFSHDTKVLQLIDYREDRIEPRFQLYTNGAKKSAGNKHYSITIDFWYWKFNYTNFDLQGTIHKRK